jgi:hypothetical protein
MSAEQDILQKLDALLGKHRGASSRSGEDVQDIPVLTDIIEETDVPPSAGDPQISSSSLRATPPEDSGANSANLADAEVETLARDIFQHVMSELTSRISSELRVHLTERLSSIIDGTVTAAIDDFKQELADVVGDAIAGALLDRAERITASQTANKPDNTSE